MSWQADEETSILIRAYCLANALEYEGAGKAGSVIGRLMGERADLRQFGKDVSPLVAGLVANANSLFEEKGSDFIRDELELIAPHLLEKKVKERRVGLPELPDVGEGEVVLRFAPNPNGLLSFGHSRGIIINSEYAKAHNGTLILRFDDTDTIQKAPLLSAYEKIEEEVEWLTGLKPKIVVASERMEQYHDHAVQLLERAGAYICLCSGEKFKEIRKSKQECSHRHQEIEENLDLWMQMKDGRLNPGDAVMRVKTDMTLPNPALRDWPAFRIQDTKTNPHPRPNIGSRWRVWPLLDFQSAVEDHLQNVTHIIRGKDLMDSTRKQVLLYEKFGWQYPTTIYWGRVKIHEYGGFSTSQIRKDIESGKYSGWDDVRLPTIAAMRRKGMNAEALKAFWIELGLTQKDISVPLSSLFSHDTKIIDMKCPRISFVREPKALELVSGGLPTSITVPSHPEHSDFKPREIDISAKVIMVEKADFDEALSKSNKFRLKELADIEITEGKAIITSIDSAGGLKIVHWVANGEETNLYYNEDDEIGCQKGILEGHPHPIGTQVQLERVGYAIIEENGLVLSHN
jgi:glutamyl-tRNA synthetase